MDKQQSKSHPYIVLSEDTRKRIIQAYNKGHSTKTISLLYSCHKTTVQRIVRAFNTDGRTSTKKIGGYKNRLLQDEHLESIKSYLNDNPSISLNQIRIHLASDHNITVSCATISNTIAKMNLKKIPSEPKSKNNLQTIT